jgi:hypothetical protein
VESHARRLITIAPHEPHNGLSRRRAYGPGPINSGRPRNWLLGWLCRSLVDFPQAQEGRSAKSLEGWRIAGAGSPAPPVSSRPAITIRNSYAFLAFFKQLPPVRLISVDTHIREFLGLYHVSRQITVPVSVDDHACSPRRSRRLNSTDRSAPIAPLASAGVECEGTIDADHAAPAIFCNLRRRANRADSTSMEYTTHPLRSQAEKRRRRAQGNPRNYAKVKIEPPYGGLYPRNARLNGKSRPEAIRRLRAEGEVNVR